MSNIIKKLPLTSSQLCFLVILAYCTCIAVAISFNGWIYEDAFITFRTIINFFDGHGLRYHTDERVLTYTHPLWMLLHIPFYGLTKNIFLVSLLLSLLCSVGACAVTMLHLRKRVSYLWLGCCFVVPLLFSKTFILFATSGFESPLVFLLYSLFCVYLFTSDEKLDWLGLSLAAAACAITRQDTLLLFLPVMVFLIYRNRNALPWGKILLGLSPLILWELFSFFYYGSFFPNTKFSKLDTGLPIFEFYIKQGLGYWIHFMHIDLISSLIVLAGIGSTGIWFWKWKQDYQDIQAAKLALLGIGLTLYVIYVIRIGGDYIGMRMWAVSLFTCLVYINYSIFYWIESISSKLIYGLAAAGLLIFSVHNSIVPGLKSIPNETMRYGLTTQHYNEDRTLEYPLTLIKNKAIEYDLMTSQANRINEEVWRLNRPILRRTCCLGIQGFYIDTRVVLSDYYGLSDAFIARLPAKLNSKRSRRTGHFERVLPEGFEQARMYGDYSRMDPDLAEYYKKIRLITSGPLYSWERIKTIIAFNLGFYNKYLDAYLNRDVQSSASSR